ncbi:MAG TPA: hypothetical protein VNP73_04255 [Actinomycetota bacterium]|nr:hypothetical protein [Actinomycetota bacterium]
MDKKLELNTETLRELTDVELTDVGGGREEITKNVTQSPVCPSGATWLQQCVTGSWC